MNERAKIAMPICVGIIMDGNRRWAKAHNLLKLEGHRAGTETLKNAVHFVRESGISHLIVYAFSTENWNREPAEVSYLMNLFHEAIRNELKELGKEGIRIRFAGQQERFSADLQKAIDDIEEETQKNDLFTLWICFSYGGRAEIVTAAAKAAASGEEITEELLARHLWTADMPDPDIIIRTGGEKRLSGFLPWQAVYSELFFTDTLWPDFKKEEFGAILTEFTLRERRRGK
ncbi:di-trans,poly-cis-decaprenylcistransferase [Candidatus Kaiserbacteria bacterium RIFCSPLOWO2_02_FULL_55_12]|uniref:Isoprenyl transferase n=2 Tax=Candidatus Kaiseribacteriota TaxID=1752734 RepID=A0A1F6F2C5_9BACT|nr:MAG: di-trans,poly-cis-decaprenylcistransferase [Candidatus Kaiserbacteria bacterium RIFCSPHIGHO2_02_FULL_55_17]OGG80016.1 MAG: di-trans,poly-cis-decaprenylcistransferase [Candidatus Kaiserbacteria bacterium RIFCSPLOWO2_02_FULL_55_12]